uniref:Uncharacterized protein n=1 Tax=Arundo donax TaxID=35708 RepID=A0A0A9HCU2_ARUDO
MLVVVKLNNCWHLTQSSCFFYYCFDLVCDILQCCE